MARVDIPDTTYKGTKVPGGWSVEIPQIDVPRSDPAFQALVRHLMRLGMTPLAAEDRARACIRGFFEGSWKTRIMKTVGRWAKVYEEQNFGSLAGFDPEKVAALWIPGAHRMLHRTSPEIDKLFVEMRRNADSRP